MDDEDPSATPATPPSHPKPAEQVRLDKWLWAARFFKTRTAAQEAVEGGRVRYAGERAKAARSVQPGALITVRVGHDDMEVLVRALSAQRVGAPQARLLYEETESSRARRQRAALERRAAMPVSTERPTKKQRRDVVRFKRGGDY